jgi:hypothetical protein
MRTLPTTMVQVLAPFLPLFSDRVWADVSAAFGRCGHSQFGWVLAIAAACASVPRSSTIFRLGSEMEDNAMGLR